MDIKRPPINPKRLEKFKRAIGNRQLDMTVILENVHDQHNVGAVLRSCDSVGIQEVYLLHSEPNMRPKNYALGKHTTAGARKWIDVHLFTDVEACFAAVRAKYDKIYATHLDADAKSLYDLNLTDSVALLFGNERDGVSQEALGHADGNFIIPQMGMVQSLNISVACAVSLYETFRQRQLAGAYPADPAEKIAERQDLLDDYMERHHNRESGEEIRRSDG